MNERHVGRRGPDPGERFAERGLGVINVAAGGQANADEFFSQLLNGCATIMADHHFPVALRRLAVRLLLVIATAADNVNQNALVGYFMIYPLYEPIMKVLVAPVVGRLVSLNSVDPASLKGVWFRILKHVQLKIGFKRDVFKNSWTCVPLHRGGARRWFTVRGGRSARRSHGAGARTRRVRQRRPGTGG